MNNIPFDFFIFTKYYYFRMKFFFKLFELGADSAPNTESIKKTILVNKISIVFLIAAIPFMLSIFIIGEYLLSGIVLFVMLGFLATLFLNKKSLFTQAKITLYITVLLSVYFYAASLGEASGIQYVYFSLIGFGYGIFDFTQTKLRYSFATLPITSFLFLHFTNFDFFYKTTLQASQLRPVFYTSVILIFIIIWITIIFYDQLSNDNKVNLKKILMTYKLSEREGDVFLLLLNGKSNKDISRNLFIEEGTVKNHLTNIYKKLNIKNRSELMAKFTI